MIYVTKFDGRREPFKKSKILRTCLRVGVDRKNAREIVDRISRNVYDGITTKEIYHMILKELETFHRPKSSIYKLRESLSLIEPHAFELFTAKLLGAFGYQTEHNIIIEGLCVDHEVDVVAKKGDELILVECKHHKNFHRFSGLDVALQVYARMEDIDDGFKKSKNKYNFTNAWIFTNSKVSDHAIRYTMAKGMKLTGWHYPETNGIEVMVQKSDVYPVTVLKVKRSVLSKMMENGIITIQDITDKKLRKLKFSDYTIENIIRQKNEILNHTFQFS